MEKRSIRPKIHLTGESGKRKLENIIFNQQNNRIFLQAEDSKLCT